MKKIEELENNHNTYSFDESKVGTWVDGKPLYRKMIQFGALQSGNTVVSHGIEDLSHIHLNLSASYFIDTKHPEYNASYAMPYEIFADRLYVNKTDIAIFSNASSLESDRYIAYVCVEYTKTTD